MSIEKNRTKSQQEEHNRHHTALLFGIVFSSDNLILIDHPFTIAGDDTEGAELKND